MSWRMGDWKNLPAADKEWHEMTPDDKAERLKQYLNRLGGEFDYQIHRLNRPWWKKVLRRA